VCSVWIRNDPLSLFFTKVLVDKSIEMKRQRTSMTFALKINTLMMKKPTTTIMKKMAMKLPISSTSIYDDFKIL